MRGQMGTQMNSIEYRKEPRHNHECKDCRHLVYGMIGKTPTYKCVLKNKVRHYTSKVMCRKFEKK